MWLESQKIDEEGTEEIEGRRQRVQEKKEGKKKNVNNENERASDTEVKIKKRKNPPYFTVNISIHDNKIIIHKKMISH